MHRLFRPTLKYWFSEVLSGMLIFAALALFFLWIDGKNSLLLAILCGLAALFFLPDALQTARTRLEIDEIGLRGLYRKQPFDYRWSEARALRQAMGAGKKRYLQIGFDAGIVELPLEQFDAARVWQWLETIAPQRVLADDAFQQLNWVKSQRELDAAILAGVSGPVRVRISAWIAGFGWFTAAGLALIGYLAWRNQEMEVVLLLLVSAIVPGYLIWAGRALVEIEPETIRLTMPVWPTYSIRWDEVQRVEADHGLNQFVLYGSGKRMTVPGPSYWRASDKRTAFNAFLAHVEQRGIPFDYRARAYFALPKGVRVPRHRVR